MSNKFMKELPITPVLQEFVKKKAISRPHLMKVVWAHIKKNKLQDSKNRRQINPDKALGKIIGTQKIDMFQMVKKLNKHFK